jgi:hypothetical protein
MKCSVILILILIVFAAGCNSNSSGGGPGTSMQGTWTATGSLSTQSAARTYQVALVSSPCSVTTPVGTFSVQGPACFIANNNTGQGSISGAGIGSSSKGQGVLIGVSANPVPAGGAFNLVFVAGDGNGNFVEFTGSGTISNGMVTGTGSCSPNTPVCNGDSATFTATLQ